MIGKHSDAFLRLRRRMLMVHGSWLMAHAHGHGHVAITSGATRGDTCRLSGSSVPYYRDIVSPAWSTGTGSESMLPSSDSFPGKYFE